MLTHGYCSVAELEGRLGTSPATEVSEAAINAASRAIDAHCHRRFWLDADVSTRVYAPDPCSSRLWVDDVSSATGLIVKSDDNGDGSFETTWTSGQYRLEPPNQVSADGIEGYPYVAVVALLRPWPYAGYLPDRVQITAKWGWAAVPGAVTAVCLEVAARSVQTPIGAKSEMLGGYSVTYSSDTAVELVESECDQLGPYAKTWP